MSVPQIPTVIGVPDLLATKKWLGIEESDTQDDDLLQTSLDAAITAQTRVCYYPCLDDGAPYVDADLYEALLLRTQRLASRRNSPESIVGITGTSGDFVGARLPATDADIVRLEAPWLKQVVS